MSDLSIRTLMLSIGALARERNSILNTLKTATREQDEDDRLSEQVLDIDQALGELADEYEAQRGDSSTYPPFEKVAGIA
jgi:hypothetical protein